MFMMMSMTLVGCGGESTEEKVDNAERMIREMNSIQRSLSAKGVDISPANKVDRFFVPLTFSAQKTSEVRGELKRYIDLGREVLRISAEPGVHYSEKNTLRSLVSGAALYLKSLEGLEERQSQIFKNAKEQLKEPRQADKPKNEIANNQKNLLIQLKMHKIKNNFDEVKSNHSTAIQLTKTDQSVEDFKVTMLNMKKSDLKETLKETSSFNMRLVEIEVSLEQVLYYALSSNDEEGPSLTASIPANRV